MTDGRPVLDEAEIAVVGAGPAGATAALTLASQGHDVVLIDKDEFPREKACGDGIIASAVSFLGELGLGDALRGAHPIEGTRLVVDWSPREARRRPVRAGSAGKWGCCLPRQILDAALVDAAIGAGARLIRGNVTDAIRRDGSVAGVELMQGGRQAGIAARHLVAADGATSRLRRRLAVPFAPQAALSYAVRRYVRTEGLIDPLFDVYAPLTDSLPGYGWVFPVSEHLANIGVGYVTARGMARPRAITDLFDWFMSSLQAHRGSELGSLQPMGPPRGAPLGINFSADHCEFDGVIFVGDAARTCDPITGEGIDEAMRSAHAAANALHGAITSRTATTDIGRSFARSRLRLGQDSAMIARLGHELLLRRNSRRVASAENSDEPPFLLWTAQTMLNAELDYPSAGASPTGQIASRLGLVEPLEMCDNKLRDRARNEFILCSELLYRDVCAGAGPAGALALLASHAQSGAAASDQVLEAALSVELLGTFSMLLSRVTQAGGSRANANNALAVMIGDFALALASAAMAGAGSACSALLADAIKSCSEAVAVFAQDRFQVSRTIERYLQWASLQGGVSLSLAAMAGAQLAGAADEVTEALGSAGRDLGIAVQICEDILAIIEPDPITGRQPRRSLEEGNFTLPVIIAASAEPDLAARLLGQRDSAAWDELVDLIHRGPGLARASGMCGKYAAKARKTAVEVLGEASPLAALCELPTRCLSRVVAAPSAQPETPLNHTGTELRAAS